MQPYPTGCRVKMPIDARVFVDHQGGCGPYLEAPVGDSSPVEKLAKGLFAMFQRIMVIGTCRDEGWSAVRVWLVVESVGVFPPGWRIGKMGFLERT